MRSIRIASYNVHQCRGLDGRVLPERIVAVLREVNADIVALQEVLSIPDQSPELDQARYLADALESDHYFLGENQRRRGGAFGNVILSRFPVVFSKNYDISWSRREPRGCLRADIRVDGEHMLHVFNLHLGTSWFERRHQARMLLSPTLLAEPSLSGSKIVLGDFNEWTRGLATRMMSEYFRSVDVRRFLRRVRSYPGLLPVLHLDNIYYDGPLSLVSFTVHRSRTALIASDHLPLVAAFRL